MKKFRLPILILVLIISLATLVACGGGNEPTKITGATVDGGELRFVMSDGTIMVVGSLPSNSEGITFTSAGIDSDNVLNVQFSDGYQRYFSRKFPMYIDKITGAEITGEGTLLIKTTEGDKDLGKIFYPTVPASPMTPSGASEYAATRDTTGRNTATVEMDIKGYGKITLLLDATTAPVTVRNFVNLAKSGFYDGLTFHRVISGFMIQGGDPLGNGTGNSGTNIYGEFSANGYTGNDILHKPGTISMARSNDKNSASCQFFICSAEYSYGDGNYAAFGYVLNGMNIVNKITELSAVYGDSNGTIADSNKQVVINSITVIEDLDPVTDGSTGGETGDNTTGGETGDNTGGGSTDNSNTDEGGWSQP